MKHDDTPDHAGLDRPPTIALECLGGHEHGQILETRAAESGEQDRSKVQGQ